MLKAVTRQARAVDAKVAAYNDTHAPRISIAFFFDHLATTEDTAVMVTERDFVEAKGELVPSVSADELRHYQRVRRTFEGVGTEDGGMGGAGTGINGVGSNERKGKGRAVVEEEGDLMVRTRDMDVNGKGKGKGKAKAIGVGGGSGHGSKGSVDIAEGGFGDAAGEDGELYS